MREDAAGPRWKAAVPVPVPGPGPATTPAPTSGASSPFNAVTTTPYADSSSSARLTNDVSCVAAAVFAANITSDMRTAACRTAMSSTAPASPVYLHKLAATTTTSHAYFLPAQSSTPKST